MLVGKRQLPFLLSIGLLIILSLLYFGFTARHLIEVHLLSGILITLISGLLFLFSLINFLVTSFIDPGYYPINTNNDEYEVIQHGISKSITVTGGATFSMRWCDECKHYRPPRSHHCCVCEMCVENFDHHCPWVDNCVGMKNYRYFVLFITSLILYILFGIGTTIAAIVLKRDSLLEVIVEFMLAIILPISLIPILALAVFHFYLMIIGKTTFEQIKSEDPSPYNKGFFCNLYLTFFTPAHPKYQKFEPSRTVRKQITTLERDRNVDKVPDSMDITCGPEVIVRVAAPTFNYNLRNGSYTSIGEKMNLYTQMNSTHSHTDSLATSDI
ncbi:Palmitoyltransferase ZDHHC5-like [Oopsacas minuta]|uniref:Palmitoyltransferase n=1 Tax=Oopsacas minuta TaxID=111878 RepID=A0AAV7JKF9_9METZ|nr:Palmitoyltransferase ZDHHC5-like [Oopsacas minuta]